MALMHMGLAAMYERRPPGGRRPLSRRPVAGSIAKREPKAISVLSPQPRLDVGGLRPLRGGTRSSLADPYALRRSPRSSLIQVKLLWLDGRIAAGLGHPGRAERCFLEVRKAFLARKLPYTAAVAALDLAILWLERGHTAQARALVAETLETFGLLGIRARP